MAYIVVENFSAGLDTRRHPLTARPGTLQTLKNAHVSRGGEIEKRKAFEGINPLNAHIFNRPFHGLQATADKIYTFTDGWASNTVSNELPLGSNGLFVRLLKHPQSTFSASPGPEGYPTLSEIVYSNLYGGKTFVLAKWSTGEVLPYLDGEFIPDFYIGQSKSWMTSSSEQFSFYNFADTFAWYIKGATYGASTTGWNTTVGYTQFGSYIDVSGPVGTEFTGSATAESPMTVTAETTVPFIAGTPETPAKGGFAINGGSVGTPALASRYLYQGLHNANQIIPPIMNIYFAGEKGIDEPGNWAGFTTATIAPGRPGSYVNTGPNLAYSIVYYLKNYARNRPGFNNSPVGAATMSYHKLDGTDAATIRLFTPNTSGDYLDDHELMNGQAIQIEFLTDPGNVNGLSEFVDITTIAPSPYTPGRFVANFGTMENGVSNKVTSVLVNGVEMLGSHVKWAFSNTDTMAKLVERINSYTANPDYAASIEDGRLVLTAPSGSGSSANGRTISVITVGNVTTANYSTFSGGKNTTPAQQQTVRYTFGGQWAPDVKVQLIATLKLDPANPLYWGNARVVGTVPTASLTYKTKAHVTSGSSLFFSGVNQPTQWGLNATGSGFINMSNNNGGNEVLTGVALYQGNVASFARRAVQIWSIDTDPANNRQGQVLSNTGALGQKSIISVGDIDVFYLSDSGIRSLRARDSSNAAVVNDVGTPIDNLVLSDVSSLAEAQKTACPAVIEPIDGRYWLAVGNKIYVYSYFPGSQVAAWSTYEPGRIFTDFTTKDGKVYAKEGNIVYIYGGLDGNTYDSSNVEVILPYLDGGKPAHMKTLMGLDMTCEGEWAVEIGMDPVSPDARDLVATVSQPTFTLGRIQATGMGTHVGVRMVNQSAGYARIANLITHFDFNESD
jgi:hypothetical protein